MDIPLLLASASPRRRELLTQIGVAFDVMAIDVPEVPGHLEAASDYVLRVANDKAEAAEAVAGINRPILAADTEVVLGERIFGKPQNFSEFAGMMKKLSGREHRVLSAVVMRWRNRSWSTVCESGVTFAELSDPLIRWYWDTTEPIGKAGGYAIQGKGALFIVHLRGSYSSVMGLPLYETAKLLAEAGIGTIPSIEAS